jgi:glycosyltransferase involved in cell wall biosynthesis
MSKAPTISVICPSYNHGRYVGDFLRSMLDQEDPRWELVIIDDCSTDDNLAQIRRFKDERIKIIARTHNRGFSAGMTEGITLASAEIIALMASDDVAHPRYISSLISSFTANPRAAAVYVSLERIDEQGVPLGRQSRLPAAWNRHELLRKSFLGPNQLPSPGMALRREVATSLHLPEGVVQYSDWMWHNQILMRGDVVLLEGQLVRYRVSAASLGYRTTSSLAREMLETRVMMDDFLAIKDMAFLAQVFPAEIIPYQSLPARHIPYVLGRLALLSEIPEKRCWGYETIMRHLSGPDMAESLREHAGFSHKDLMAMVPTEAASLVEDARRVRRQVRHLRRWAVVLAAGLMAALVFLFR